MGIYLYLKDVYFCTVLLFCCFVSIYCNKFDWIILSLLSRGHKHKPLFYQISPQILPKSKELLLPQRAWKVNYIPTVKS